jgi:hypothetical protein
VSRPIDRSRLIAHSSSVFSSTVIPMTGCISDGLLKYVSQVVVASIVTRAPTSTMAAKAFVELNLAVSLYEKGAAQSYRARVALVWSLARCALLKRIHEFLQPIVLRMKEKAKRILSNRHVDGTALPIVNLPHDPDYVDDDLEIFAGFTKVIVSKQGKSDGKSPSNSSGSTSSSQLSPESTDLNQSFYVDSTIPLMGNANFIPPVVPMDFNPGSHSSGAPMPDFANSMNAPQSYDNSAYGIYGFSGDMDFQFAENPKGLSHATDPQAQTLMNEMNMGIFDSGTGSGMNMHWMSFMRDLGFVDQQPVTR